MPLCYNNFCGNGNRMPVGEVPTTEIATTDINEYLRFATPIVEQYIESLHDGQRANSGESAQLLMKLDNIRFPEEVSNPSVLGSIYEERLYFALTQAEELTSDPIDSLDLVTMRLQFKDFSEWPAVARRDAIYYTQQDSEISEKVSQHFEKFFGLQKTEELKKED